MTYRCDQTTVVIESPVGPLTLVATANGLHAVLFGAEAAEATSSAVDPGTGAGAADVMAATILAQAEAQLAEYFAGERERFELPLAPRGTPFQIAAWETLRGIPYGATITYGEQARRLGRPAAARAVGAANGRNPLSIVVPCHRVVGADGRLVGFGGGIATKRFLLDLEMAHRW